MPKSIAEPVVNKSVSPRAVARAGTRVRITKGDLPDNDGTTTVADLSGQVGRIDGAPYVAKAGPNKGKVCQPIRMEGTSTLVAVPTDRVSHADSGHSRPSIGWTPQYEREYERIFGKRK